METHVADDYAAIAQRQREIDAERKAEKKPPSSASWAWMSPHGLDGFMTGSIGRAAILEWPEIALQS